MSAKGQTRTLEPGWDSWDHPSGARALRSGALESCISPWKGVYMCTCPESRRWHRKPIAQKNKIAIAVALRGAKRPKLIKIMASQTTTKDAVK